MSALNKPQSLSFDEYLDLERHSETKHEYVGGYIHAMAGASEVHNRIAGNLFFHLRAAARGGPCGVFMSDMKVRVDSHDVSYYPDVSVVCDSQDKDPYVKRKPCVVVEVLSSTTEATDRREKWLAYRSIPSLCYYLLVSSDRKRVEYFARGPEGAWESALMDEDDTLSIVCEGYSAQLTLAAIYEDVRLPSSHRFAV